MTILSEESSMKKSKQQIKLKKAHKKFLLNFKDFSGVFYIFCKSSSFISGAKLCHFRLAEKLAIQS